jgi:hypothetical protein
MPKFHVHWKGA